MEVNKYRVWCNTDSRYEFAWSEADPTVCPIDGSHSINATLTSIIERINDPVPQTSRGYAKVEVAPREGSRLDSITPNYCDPTTWYVESKPVEDELLTDSGDLTTWTPTTARPWIDVCHGKLTGERQLRAQYQSVIKVDGVEKVINSPGQTDGDYEIDYSTGAVTFNSALIGGSVVRASYCYSDGSMWAIKPAAGKQIRITYVEIQFSENLDLTDTVIFEPYGPVEIYAPGLVNDVDPDYVTSFPMGTMLPLGGQSVYQTMQDYINEAEESYPGIPAMGGASWRGMRSPEHLFRWPYERRGTTDITDSSKIEIRIRLEEDVAFGGDIAIVTFYGLSMDEGAV